MQKSGREDGCTVPPAGFSRNLFSLSHFRTVRLATPRAGNTIFPVTASTGVDRLVGAIRRWGTSPERLPFLQPLPWLEPDLVTDLHPFIPWQARSPASHAGPGLPYLAPSW